jgi:5-methylcytosine-specific restriction protein B
MPFEPKKITKDNAALINLISKYKELIKTTHFEGEIYKWELTKRFHKRPNTNAPDFSEEISSIDFSNLIYQMGISVSKHIARERPEEFRKAFKDLFNESEDITLRTNRFDEEALRI